MAPVLAVTILPLVFAAVLFPLGGFVLSLLARSHRWGELLTSSVNVLAWLLIALASVLVLYAFFPTSEASGTVLNISVGGGLAAFVLIWMLGTRSTGRAIHADELTAQRDQAVAELERERTLHDDTEEGPVEHELTSCQAYEYPLSGARGKRLAIITGNLRGVGDHAQVWVNSENTHMQMARFFDRSVSGTIRYLGARKQPATGQILEDTIAEELEGATTGAPLAPGTVLATGPGALRESHGVKRIYHVAAVHGEAGSGYHPVADLGNCVRSCLQLADSEDERSERLESILFPLLGSGTGRGGRRGPIQTMLDAALDYLESTQRSTIKTVYFLSWTDDDLATCQQVCARSERLLDAASPRGVPVRS